MNIFTPLGGNDRTGKTTNVKQQYNFFFSLFLLQIRGGYGEVQMFDVIGNI
jgi:hypothetical protein